MKDFSVFAAIKAPGVRCLTARRSISVTVHENGFLQDCGDMIS